MYKNGNLEKKIDLKLMLDFAFTSEYLSKNSSSLDTSVKDIADNYGYNIIGKYNDPSSTYRAFVFEHKEKKEIVISHSNYRVKSIQAFLADPSIKNFSKAYFYIKPSSSEHTKSSLAYMKSVYIATHFVGSVISSKPDYKIIQVGHSCGGLIAQHIYSIYDLETYCIECPGARSDSFHGYENINFQDSDKTDPIYKEKLVTIRKNPINYYFNRPNLINSFGERFFLDSKINIIVSKSDNPDYTVFDNNDNKFDFSFIKFIKRSVYEHLIETIAIKLDKNELQIVQTSSPWTKNYLDAYSYFMSKTNETYWDRKFTQFEEYLSLDLIQYSTDMLSYFKSTYICNNKKINSKNIFSIQDLPFEKLIEDYIYSRCVSNCMDFFLYQATKFKIYFTRESIYEVFEKKLQNKLEMQEIEINNKNFESSIANTNKAYLNSKVNRVSIYKQDSSESKNIKTPFRGSIFISKTQDKARKSEIQPISFKQNQDSDILSSSKLKTKKIKEENSFSDSSRESISSDTSKIQESRIKRDSQKMTNFESDSDKKKTGFTKSSKNNQNLNKSTDTISKIDQNIQDSKKNNNDTKISVMIKRDSKKMKIFTPTVPKNKPYSFSTPKNLDKIDQYIKKGLKQSNDDKKKQDLSIKIPSEDYGENTDQNIKNIIEEIDQNVKKVVGDQHDFTQDV